MIDPIVDRSPRQKRIRMEALRAELAERGYSIVETEWLNAVLLANLDRPKGRPARRVSRFECNEQAAG